MPLESAHRKNPGVSTVSGSGPLNGNRYSMTLARIPKSEDISSPFPVVKIRGQKRTRIIRKHRIDTHQELAYRLVRQFEIATGAANMPPPGPIPNRLP
jgi:hypothetical protein